MARPLSPAAIAVLLALASCDGAAEPAPESPTSTASRPVAQGDPASASEGAWLIDRSADAGLEFVVTTGARGAFHLPEIMGGGLAVFDADGDDRFDLYFTRSGPDRFLRGTGDGLQFVDATEAAGLATPGHGMGVAVGDVDADGDLDLFVARVERDRLFINRGDGTFEDRSAASGVDSAGWSTSAAWFDADGDGDLDLWVCRYVELDPEERCTGFADADDYCGPLTQPALADRLYLNRGDGTFVDVSETAGIAGAPQPGLGVVCRDFTGDGRVDVFVANDAAPNQLWRNLGDGRFEDVAPEFGLQTNGDGALEAGMGVVAADLSGDGAPELLLTHLRGESNTLYASEGTGWRDVTDARGLAAASLGFTGFGVVAFDLEADGDLDLAVANGHVNRGPPNPGSTAPEPWNEFGENDHLFLNDGAGRFTPAPREGAGLCRAVRTSRALVAADLDRDGDLDLIASDLEQRPRVIENAAPRAGRWLAVALRDGGLEVPGAHVTVRAGGRVWLRTVGRDGGYLSSKPAEEHFGLGPLPDGGPARVEVRWPDGELEHFEAALDRRSVLVRGAGER